MDIILTLFLNKPYLIIPSNIFAWLGLVGLIVVLFLLIYSTSQSDIYQDNNPDAPRDYFEIQVEKGEPFLFRKNAFLWLLIIMALFLVMQLGIELAEIEILPLPYFTLDITHPTVMLLAGIPWMLAAGFLGIPQAAILGLWSGALYALWGTHNPFTILEFGIVAVLFAACINQRYRTRIFRLFRQPLFSALVIGVLIYPIIFLFGNILFPNGSLPVRLDYALTNLKWSVLSINIQLLIAGLVSTVIRNIFPTSWGGQPPWLISPIEERLDTRFFRTLLPVYFIILTGLIYATWTISIQQAKNLVQTRMENTATLATENIPYFLSNGKSLIMQIAHDDLRVDDLNLLDDQLRENYTIAPFFQELMVVNVDDEVNIQATFPRTAQEPYLDPYEFVGIQVVLSGVPVQVYSILPIEDSSAGTISFITPIQEQDSESMNVLIGRTNLGLNPQTEPIIKTLQSLEDLGGEGFLIDEAGRYLYHTDSSILLTSYSGVIDDSPTYDYELASDGTRNLVFYYPSAGSGWSVITVVPASTYQEIALQTLIPILAAIFLVSIILGLYVRGQLRSVTGSLENLAKESERIIEGDLETAFTIDSSDEVGQLSRSIDEMRISLKNRLEELNRLLVVSRGISSTLEIGEIVRPILDAALTTGANSARIIFTQEALPTASIINKVQTRFGAGKATEQFSYLDYQILQLNREQDTIVISNPLRTPMLKFGLGSKPPGAILAFAIIREDIFFGTLWLAFEKPHKVSEDDLSFLKTLAGNAGMAAANSRLYLNAELGRQRLSGILASTPDPVLVTDHRGNILEINPAASMALGIKVEDAEQYLIDDVIEDPKLIRLLKSTDNIDETAEITLADNKNYLATRSIIRVEGQQVGYVCILRDVTYFKQLDGIKTEFVSTVSHDLRRPLTLMKGYATMLELVGDLNDQQNQYVKKIITGVEGMTVLVSDLLDLGRIEAEVGLRLDNVPVHDVIRRVIQEMRPLADQKQITITMEPSTGTIPLLEADKTLLHQAFKNLLDNAIKYTDRSGSIWVRYYVSNERIIVEFEDTGVGISPVDQKRLFEKFYKSTSLDSRRERGTGLGLAIVKSIADRHGGSVWVDSHLGKGSTFYFAIPIRHN